MLHKSLDLTVKHDVIGAFVFFVTHLIMLIGLSTLFVHVLGATGIVETTVGTFFEGGSTYTLIGTLFVLWLGGSILTARGLTSDVMSVIVVGIGLYLAYTVSIVLGLVPIALLTTMGKK